MAKRQFKSLIVTDDNINQMLKSGTLKINTPEVSDDPEVTLRNRVLLFRGQGFDNNRIAALLGIQKSVVDGIE